MKNEDGFMRHLGIQWAIFKLFIVYKAVKSKTVNEDWYDKNEGPRMILLSSIHIVSHPHTKTGPTIAYRIQGIPEKRLGNLYLLSRIPG